MRFLSRSLCAAIAALAVLATASAGVNNPQSGWYSGNPLLGPNALRDLACAGSTCYAAGDFGTLLKSDDGGSTWKGIVTGLTLDLSRVALAGGQSDKVIAGGGCALRRSDDGGNNFMRLPFTARDRGCNSQLIAFSFPTDKNGYLLLASGRILSTSDGGRSFSRRTNAPVNANDLVCTDASTCFAGGPGSIVRTDDGGVSWTQVASPPFIVNRLVAADATTLYAGEQFGYLSKSVDGGQTWDSFRLGNLTNDINDIACGDALHCLMATHNGTLDGPVYRTEDGGTTGAAVTPSTDATYAVGFSGPTQALAAGALGSAEISNDTGATWTAVGTHALGAFTTLTASGNVAYAGGLRGALARTGNGGQSWSTVSPPTDADIRSVAAAGPDRLYVLDSEFSLQRSDNGGASYSLLNPGSFRPYALAAIDHDRLLLLGSGISLSRDGGETFTRATGKIARESPEAADLAPGAVFVWGHAFRHSSLFVSTDRGDHWKPVAKPKRRGILDVDFVGRNLGYVLDVSGNLWKTTNGGHDWKSLPGVGSPGFAIEFSSPLDGYVAVQGYFGSSQYGVVLRTTDGGRSWHPQLVSSFAIATLESGGSVDYALAGSNALYATAVGGDVGSASTLTISAKPRSLRRKGHVLVSGRLTPADGGEEIVVSKLENGRWTHRLATAASNGTFDTRWPVRRNAVFVAQVLGDADHRGAGTKPLTVKVR